MNQVEDGGPLRRHLIRFDKKTKKYLAVITIRPKGALSSVRPFFVRVVELFSSDIHFGLNQLFMQLKYYH